MALDNEQNEPSLPGGDGSYRRESSNHLPRFFRTDFNKKFLNATLDQMLTPGKVEKLNGYYGRKNAKAYKSDDSYIADVTANRENYQFEPVTVIKDGVGNVDFYSDYNDYINTIDILKGNISDHSKLNEQEYYTWSPQIDWDKFINFREYYWMPLGPELVTVVGQTKEIESTYDIKIKEEDENSAYVFTPNGFTTNPTFTLYRGQTYRFEIDVPNFPIAFVTRISFVPGKATLIEAFEGERRPGVYDYLYYDQDVERYDAGGWLIPPREGSFTEEEQENASLLYRNGMTFYDENGNENPNIVFVENGVIEFKVPETAPDVLYYISKDDANVSGMIKIQDIIEATEIDVEKEIIGKKDYKTTGGWNLSNGMKLEFAGDVFPTKYGEGEWYVEGVGERIELINRDDLELNSLFVDNFEVEFDDVPFDYFPFSEAMGYPRKKDYIVINRGSKDGNAWSKHNRWFHIDVIEKSLELNGLYPTVDQNLRARRPIIEFDAGLHLHKFGTYNKKPVDLVDTYTKDAFSTIEGSVGYNIDETDVTDGMRILFIADTDKLVRNKIFKVKFIVVNNSRQITLLEESDTDPLLNETVLITKGKTEKGKFYYYDGIAWKEGQAKKDVNQPPLFALYSYDDISYVDPIHFKDSQFQGNKIFSYKVGTGTDDNELGFPLSYQNISNSGDILFSFDLVNEEFIHTRDNQFSLQKTETAFLRKYVDRETYHIHNGWVKASKDANQNVIRQFIATGLGTDFPIDVYDDLSFVNDAWLRVYLNNKLQVFETDFTTITNVNGNPYVRFLKQLKDGDVVQLKTRSNKPKNENGYYEIPYSLERNPKNENIKEFTLGEVIDHVVTIAEEDDRFLGNFPGNSNLRDLGPTSHYGRKFLKHSAPFNIAAYHLMDTDSNVLESIHFASKEYAKFKRLFLETSENLGYDGPIKQHVDKIMEEIVRDKTDNMPFYFSDMIPITGSIVNTEEIFDEDQEYFALSEIYDLEIPSYKAVQIYLNGKQLIYKRDYEFNDEGFVRVFAKKKSRDIIEIYEYQNTVGCYVPPTPTKLGLYPKYEPQFYIDDTVQVVPYFDITGPFKVYAKAAPGYPGDDKVGWFYPLYTAIDDVKLKDTELGGNGEFTVHRFGGMQTTFFMPKSDQHIAAQDHNGYEEWTEGQAVIQGHDGSIVAAFKDYRDELILELEKRIYNNLKINYNPKLFDIHGIREGLYRKTGIPKKDVDTAMIGEFLSWAKLINRTYTDHIYYDKENTFTFNYHNTRFLNGEKLSGWWREAFRYAFDTDRPHTHPWEMLGFTVKPKWWAEQYGEAPYTSNNFLMWEDIEKGIIRQPRFKIDKRFVRPGLRKNLPVDAHGVLLSPSSSNLIKSYEYDDIDSSFVFGDGGPVESAWKRSSEYPFSLLKACILNRPLKTFATAYDRIRQIRNNADQIVYSEIQQPLQLSKIAFPSSVNSPSNVITSGLINYIVEYRSVLTQAQYDKYKSDLSRITNQLSFKIGGYTDKSKFKLILDSRSPLNEGNIFIPSENYTVSLGSSYPVQEFMYSGVIIEKQPEGFYVRGYDTQNPSFSYHKPNKRDSDTWINVGGITVPYLYWGEGKIYSIDTIVKFDSNYWRCGVTHRSTAEFDVDKFHKLPVLPTIGGVDAQIRKTYEYQISHLDYGSLLTSHQDVVDFLLGYGEYLKNIGFEFSVFNDSAYELSDWLYAAKQYLFWVTQSWDAGALITLSPGAEMIKFKNNFSTVSNVFDTSSGYSVLRADGTPLKNKYLKILRDRDNVFTMRTSNTRSGIYAVRIPIVLKEHVVLIDNKTIFNDVIYDMPAGYRQERIKVLGYRTDGWNGSLNIPGFIYDAARVTDWKEWQDYAVGDMVKYKEFYYSANTKIVGSTSFKSEDWTRLADKPEPKLYANFDYRVEQFGDFYDLDSDNLDTEQQRMAQHLIGYQKRKYLQNIINNEVSQYKFYQGMLQEKGTRNSLTKLFDVLSGTDTDSLEFYEEWAIKNGQYGAVAGFDEVEYILDETKFRLVPQPVLLTDNASGKETDLIYRIQSHETYLKPQKYNHKPFPTKCVIDTFTKNSGYVYVKDVDYTLFRYTQLVDLNTADIKQDDYVWVGNTNDDDWGVYRYSIYPTKIEKIWTSEEKKDHFLVSLPKIPHDIEENDVIGITKVQNIEYEEHEDSTVKTIFTDHPSADGFYKVTNKSLNVLELETTSDKLANIAAITDPSVTGLISVFKLVRYDGVLDISNTPEEELLPKSKFWVDNAHEDKWAVVEKLDNIEISKPIVNPTDGYDYKFGATMAVNKNNTLMVTGAPYEGDGKVYIFTRASQVRDWQLAEVLEPSYPSVASANQGYGFSVDIDPNGKYVIVGAPFASNIKTNSVGLFDEDVIYTAGQIVEHNGSFWQAIVDVFRASEKIKFQSFVNTSQDLVDYDLDDDDDPPINYILTGDYPLDRIHTDHFLLRLPDQMYKGVQTGDQIKLKWNTLTNANQTQIELTAREPFNGEVGGLTSADIDGWHTVEFKIDVILYIKNLLGSPNIDDIVSSETGVGRVAYFRNETGYATIYINEVVGNFEATGTLMRNEDVIGDYDLAAPNNSDNFNISENYGGYVFVKSPNLLTVGFTTVEYGRGLVIVDADVHNDPSPRTAEYYNILDYIPSTTYGDNTEISMIRTLSCQGTMLVNAGLFSDDPIQLPYYGVRGPKVLTDKLSKGDKLSTYFNTLKKTVTVLKVRNTRFTLPPEIFEGEILTQAGTGATATVFSDKVEIAAETTDPANPIYDIQVIWLSPIAKFNKADELFGSRSGQLYIRPVFEPVEGPLTKLSEIGIPDRFNNNSNSTEVWDLWDGFIDYSEEFYSYEGLPYVPKSVYVYNGFGDFNDTGITPHVIRQPSTGATAEVMYLQRLSEKTLRAYVKNVTGQWTVGTKYDDEQEIEMVARPGEVDVWARRNIFDIPRTMGHVIRTSLGYESEGVGKMIIFRDPTNLPIIIDEDTGLQKEELSGYEYWFYWNREVEGMFNMSNEPTSSSSVWREVFNIQATSLGYPSDKVNEGMVYIYQRFGDNFVLDKMLVAPNRESDQYFGYNVKLRDVGNDFYNAYVLAKGADESYDNPGKLYFLKQGEDDRVFYNWDYSKDKRFRGEFDETQSYKVRDIVYLGDKLYSAKTNIIALPFDIDRWTEIQDDEYIDYVGYIPNDLPYNITGPLGVKLDRDTLYDFGTVYDVSMDGEVIAAYIKYALEPNVIAIYRNYEGRYLWAENIYAPTKDAGFGESIALNEDGSVLVVGAPFDDSVDHDQGRVYVYKMINGSFEIIQEIECPNDEALEMFGTTVDISKDFLSVGAKNGEDEVPTTIDSGVTTFDLGFTRFRFVKKNVGVVHMYQNYLGKYIYGETVGYDLLNESAYGFGEYAIYNNNHLYVGMPETSRSESSEGIIVNYHKTSDYYHTLREPKPTVDVDKMKRVILYNIKENKIVKYLDYVDPLQGKIPGIADENLSYKLYYDPARYNEIYNPSLRAIYNKENSWGKQQVGQLWWDLNNAKYYHPYQEDVTYSTNYWSKTFDTNSIDVYEWVESDILPSAWDLLADTLEGLALGISGQSRYGDQIYVELQEYDSIAQIFIKKYYFWVKDKRVIPNVEGRTMHSYNVAQLIQDPAQFGYPFVAMISDSSFSVYNATQYLEDQNIAISFQYWNIEDQDINIHNEYQILSENLAISMPRRDIEMKWVDSLVGYDKFGRTVPDPALDPKYRYGTLNEPRQGWFVNRIEALKQFVERLNYVLKQHLIVDNKSLTKLHEYDKPPLKTSNLYDIEVDLRADLDQYGTSRLEEAKVILDVVDGRIDSVLITNPGRGYFVSPSYHIKSRGQDAIIEFDLNSVGSLIRAHVINGGKNYHDGAEIELRRFTALVRNDETIEGKWALYERDRNADSWRRIQSQGYDVRLYWDYIDWYKAGFSEVSAVKHIVQYSYELPSVEDSIGDLVKINHIGSGGWLLLRKIDNQLNVDYTVNYETIGREKGTIEFKSSLYDPFAGLVNFDIINYDINFYDGLPSKEIRYIAQAIKEDIFIDDLAVEYNKLFFAAIRYVLTEGTNVDWLFKTSFIRAKHNVGTLREDITFNNDNLSSYQDYISEVKAFKAKIREYISSYEKTDSTVSRITDFDLPPYYSPEQKKIVPHAIKIWDDNLLGAQFVDTYPNKNWYDNSAYVLTEVRIVDPGYGYQSPPQVVLTGGGGSGAKIRTHLGSNGIVRLAEIIDEGKGYYSLPKITINGSLEEGGRPVILSVKIGRALPRSLKTDIKFDRITGKYFITELEETDNIISSGSQYVFDLTWPMNLRRGFTKVYVDDNALLTSQFTYKNVLDTSKSYDRYHGQITFTEPAPKYSKIRIEYIKDAELLSAADRVNLYYEPEVGQFGKDLSQLMDGVDYGGVEVKAFDFGNKVGWDTENWYDTSWDSYDLTFTDQSFKVIPNILLFPQLGYKLWINWGLVGRDINFAKDPLNLPAMASPSFINIYNKGSQFEMADLIHGEDVQKYALGTLTDPDALSVIDNYLIPRFGELTVDEIDELIKDGLLKEIAFEAQQPLENGELYNVYYNGIRIDDEQYGTGNETNPNAKIKTITGDGTNIKILLRDVGIDPEVDDMFVLRKPSSDGSFLPSEFDYDTMLSGGSLAYANAKGITAEEIVVDGDNFITPMTSKGPEEQVPGHLVDTLDITVFERPTPGVSTITSRNFTTDGTNKIYPIGVSPLTEHSLMVKVDGKLKKVKTDYKINSADQTIEFTRKPRAGRKVSLITLDYSGTDILDVDTIIADGVSVGYYINVRWSEDLSSQVSVNAENQDYTLVKSDDSSYPTPDNVVIQFALPPPKGSIIRYAIFKGDEGKYSTVTVDTFTADGSSIEYQLSQIPEQQEPTEWYTMVLLNGDLLNPGYVETITLTDAREYKLKLYQVPLSSVDVKQMRVFLNDHELENIKEWRYSSLEEIDPLLHPDQQAGSLIQLQRGTGQPGDIMKVYVTGQEHHVKDAVSSGGDYRYGYFDKFGEFVKTPGILYINKPHNAGDEIMVYQFSNHDSQGIDWQSFDIEERTALRQGYIESSAVFIVPHPTSDITLDFELEYGSLYSVTLNDIRIDDINYGSDDPVTNPFAKIKPIEGDGTNILHLPDIGPFIKENDFMRIEKIGAEMIHDASSKDWYEFRLMQNGFIPLNKPAIEVYYVWVAVNGKLLAPSVDYRLTNDKKYIKLAKNLLIGDNVQTIHFSNRPQSGKLGWRQFKDVLNRTHYMIIDGTKNIELAQDLHWNDKTVELVDASHLPDPGKGAKNPGVVFINKERVEYFERVNNRLQQLRRGTLGTGVNAVVPAGTEIYNGSVTMMLPYKDETKTLTHIADGISNEYELDFVPNSVNEFEVYVAGIRLRKTPLESYQLNSDLRKQYAKDGQLVAQDSPEGDVTLPPEFAVDGNKLILLHTPEKNQHIHIIRKLGAPWTEKGKALGESETLIARMIKSAQVDLPR